MNSPVSHAQAGNASPGPDRMGAGLRPARSLKATSARDMPSCARATFVPVPDCSCRGTVIRLSPFRRTCLPARNRQWCPTQMLTEDLVRNALRAVKYPGYSRDIVSFGLVKEVAVQQGAISVALQLTSSQTEAAKQIKAESERALKALPGVTAVHVEIRQPAGTQSGAQSPWSHQNRVPGLRRIVAVASGKGGVGKSTVRSTWPAPCSSWARGSGCWIAIFTVPASPDDGHPRDVHRQRRRRRWCRPSNHGVKLMSMGLLLEGDQPVIWRGPDDHEDHPAVHHARSIGANWIICWWICRPAPGTPSSRFARPCPLDGGVIVTTPQEASLGVVRKGIAMFQKVNVPILGIDREHELLHHPDGRAG